MTPSQTETFPNLPKVESVDDLLALAHAIEEEAAARYTQLAEEMTRHDNPETAKLFRELAAEERGHVAHVETWAQRMASAPPVSAKVRWRMPEALGERDVAEAGGAYLLTPHKALSIAVENEEHAFAFYVDLAAIAADKMVREMAEALAKEEIGHVAQLRLARRRAWRAQRAAAEKSGRVSRPLPQTLAELLVAAREMAAESAKADGAAAEAMAQGGGNSATVALLRRLAEEAERQARDLSAELATIGADAPDAVPSGAGLSGTDSGETPKPSTTPPREGAETPLEALRGALLRTEDIFEFLAAAAEHSTEEALLARAQALAETAVQRLALIRTRLPD